jgi:hypothetical protein
MIGSCSVLPYAYAEREANWKRGSGRQKTTKRLKRKYQPRKATVSTWKPGGSTLDWSEFAQCNGIEIPADVKFE